MRAKEINLFSFTDEQQKVAECLRAATGISPLTAKLLVQRGIGDIESVKLFLQPTLKNGLPDPVGVKNLDLAANALLAACKKGEQITLYSDFDVDGLTSCAQLYLFLKAIGAEVNYYLPNRFVDGYGLSMAAVEKLIRTKTAILVTLDCGTSNKREIEKLKHYGVRTIVVDHHEVIELPPAEIVVNPEQEGCSFQEHSLATAGLVWMLLIVMRKKLPEFELSSSEKTDPKAYLDLAALGTICDMVPLLKTNRTIACRGVEALKLTKRPGIEALKNISGLSANPRFGSGHVGFVLGPRINAAGRMADPQVAFNLLTTSDHKEAATLADHLNRLNDKRRQTEEEMLRIAEHLIDSSQALVLQPVLVVYDSSFHLGVIGIVAQRLVEKYQRPAFVMAPGEMIKSNEKIAVIKGSARSIKGVDVVGILQSCASELLGFGGHEQAGGFSLLPDKLGDFASIIERVAQQQIGANSYQQTINCDLKTDFAAIDFQLAEEFQMLSPFGIKNPTPLLYTENVTIDSINGLDNNNYRFILREGKYFLPAVAWGKKEVRDLRKGSVINIVYQLEINTYQGISSAQLNLKEILS
ncbi:MAG: single-stranded-DNA-specific exonuclease RecJ [Deltaproteobacteria bacterium]|nr:single-stranded-DNA-specific exonuclease RecJ [Deltaproteobacteria bacterium]